MNVLWFVWCPPKYRISGGVCLSAQMGEVHTDSSKMLAVLDPQEVWAVASTLAEIDLIIRSRLGHRSNVKYQIIKLLN